MSLLTQVNCNQLLQGTVLLGATHACNAAERGHVVKLLAVKKYICTLYFGQTADLWHVVAAHVRSLLLHHPVCASKGCGCTHPECLLDDGRQQRQAPKV